MPLDILGIYWVYTGHIGIVEKKMETAIVYWREVAKMLYVNALQRQGHRGGPEPLDEILCRRANLMAVQHGLQATDSKTEGKSNDIYLNLMRFLHFRWFLHIPC